MFYEMDDYIPHLTLALGLPIEQLTALQEPAFTSLAPFPTFTVSSIRLYEKAPAEDHYHKYMDIPLGRY
jgi:hypothetical protein